ncbi:Cystatin domain [Dillenia turbinata]|uniref:Cysteine proteinase inhibitor n=1 Tax=Dillenia turbinata TaxID=194707 RepID=A0AAN8ZLD8_9MAGN
MKSIDLCIKLLSFVLLLSVIFELGFCREEKEEGLIMMKPVLGGLRDVIGTQNSAEIEGLGRFAVQEHNKKQNAVLEFARVLKAKEQVVAGKLYHLTLEAIDAGKKKVYEAKVWVKPWMNFKELQEFKHAQDSSSFATSDLGDKQDGHGAGWQAVPTDDPIIQDAASHAVKTIQMMSNSIYPYELREILLAKAEVVEDMARFELLLKLKRGNKEEKFSVHVGRSVGGKFHMSHMKLCH